MNGMNIGQVLHLLGLDNAVPIILAIATLSRAVDALIAQPAPGSHWLPVRKLVSIGGLGVGNAKPAGQPSVVTWLQRLVILLAQAVPLPSAESVGVPAARPQPPSPLFDRRQPVLQPVAAPQAPAQAPHAPTQAPQAPTQAPQASPATGVLLPAMMPSLAAVQAALRGMPPSVPAGTALSAPAADEIRFAQPQN